MTFDRSKSKEKVSVTVISAAFRSVAVRQLISRLVSCVSCIAGDLWTRIDRLLFGQLSSRDVSVLFSACTDRPNSRAAVTNNLVTVGHAQVPVPAWASCRRVSMSGELTECSH